MDVDTFINSDYFQNLLNKSTENLKYETIDKIKSDLTLLSSEVFNEGIQSIVEKRMKPSTSGPFEKSVELTNLLPDNFVKTKIGKEATTSIMESIKMNQKDYVLNIGYEDLVKREIENMIRIIYAIGLSTGFDIADDKDYKAMYLANKSRFILHGSEEKKPKK